MEIKVECACGQRFKFDAEPVDGRVPFEVRCPTCGADDTALANELLSGNMRVSPAPAAAPAGLRLSRAETISAPQSASVGLAAPSVPAPIRAPLTARPDSSGPDGFVKGVAGAFVASLVGMAGWFLLIKLTNYEIGFAAWGVGALTGMGTRVLGAKGSNKLGVLAGAFALIAILGGEFLAARSVVDKAFEEMAQTGYDAQMAYAKEAVAVKTDQESKALIAKREEKQVSQVTDNDLKQFREEEVPKARDFIAGKPSKAEFIAAMNEFKNSFGMEFEVFKHSVGLFTLLWIFLGVGSAYKLGSRNN